MDIAALADAWEQGNVEALAPYCTLEDWGTPDRPNVQRVIDTDLWHKIMDEVESRRWQAQRAREDMLARDSGFRSARHALAELAANPNAEAAQAYLHIFGDEREALWISNL